MQKNKTIVESPSNIALVKYWGKIPIQIPKNPSISFTLSNCKTNMDIELIDKSSGDVEVELFFEGKLNQKFSSKIQKFLTSIKDEYNFINTHKFVIKSNNTFPHSSGIASSASSMSALAIGLESLKSENIDYHKASYIARLGSGSACRSIIDRIGWWGRSPVMYGSSDEYAVQCLEFDEIFDTFKNAILIVNSKEKSVGSTAGHSLMENNLFAKPRYIQANENISSLYGAMREGDLEKWGEILESEALTLHALMMMSTPSFTLLEPNSLAVINKIREVRKLTNIPMYFTIDAGPNIHLLYPKTYSKEVLDFIENELVELLENGKYINDEVGNGAKVIQ